MKLSNVGVALGLVAATIGVSSYAGDSAAVSKASREAERGMRAVPLAPEVGAPARGWQYFSDAREARAVVISPTGDYYFSDGQGLKLMFKAARAATA